MLFCDTCNQASREGPRQLTKKTRDGLAPWEGTCLFSASFSVTLDKAPNLLRSAFSIYKVGRTTWSLKSQILPFTGRWSLIICARQSASQAPSRCVSAARPSPGVWHTQGKVKTSKLDALSSLNTLLHLPPARETTHSGHSTIRFSSLRGEGKARQ